MAAILIRPSQVVKADGPTTFPASGSITINDNAAASQYPWNVNVTPAMAGNITKIRVFLNGVAHACTNDIDIMLEGPTGLKATIMSDVGGCNSISGVNLTLDDAAANSMPTSLLSTGTYKPTDVDAAADTAWPAPAPAESGLTALSTFNGTSPNGLWKLWVRDDATDDAGSMSGWSLEVTTAAGASATTTTVTSSSTSSASTLGDPVTFTAQVSSSATVNVGTVTFQDGASNLTCTEGANPRPVNASGMATCTTSALPGGNRTINATYNDSGSTFLSSTGSMIQQVTTVSGSTFSNVGSIEIEPVVPDTQESVPYPGRVVVSGLSGTIATVSVGITGLTHTDVRDLDVVLISPTGTPYVFLSDVGSGTDVSNVNLTIADSAGGQMPIGGTLVSGTFQPTNNGSGDAIPNTSLGTVTASGTNTAAPAGTGTLTNRFGGAAPNGIWSLYVYDDAGGDVGTISGGWSLTFTTNGGAAATTTTLTSSLNPSFTSAPDHQTTFTATVMSSGNPVTTGDVNFKEGAVDLTCTEGAQPRPLNGSGQATCTATFATEGQHVITAFYNGTASFGISSGQVTQTVNNHTTGTPPQFCNAGPLTIPSSGTANPYPSQIFVTGLTGTFSKVTATVNGFSHTSVKDVDVLLAGPGGQRVILLSDIGDNTGIVSNVNLTLDDAAASSLPSSGAVSSGTFKPTEVDSGGADVFPAPAAGGPTGTTMAAFNTSTPNGTWSVFVVDDSGGDTGQFAGGVCLNFTMTAAATTTTVVSNHNPSFNGQQVTFTATVSVPSPGVGTATGTVQFKDGMTNIGGPVAVDGSGQAQVMTSTLTPGSHSITAEYSATGNFMNSTSQPLTQVVTVLTAGNVEVSGRVITAGGRGIGAAVVTLTDNEGTVYQATTFRGGMFRFTGVPSGKSYILSVQQPRFRFTPVVIAVNDNVTTIEIIGEPPQ